MRIIITFSLIFIIPLYAMSQNLGSIPAELLRPARGETPRYPIDIVIGELGRGNASAAAYSFADSVGTGLISGQMDHQALSSINSNTRENYLSALSRINPASFRIGSGRNEPDGSVSFLVRFIGRDRYITGELYIRYVTRQIRDEDGETRTNASWILEDLLIDDPKNRESISDEADRRNDFYPYERSFQ